MMSSHVVRLAGAAALAAGMLMAQGAPPGPGMQDQNFMQQRLQRKIDRMAIILDLTQQQKTQIQQIASSAMSQAQPLIEQLRTNRREIQRLVTSGVAPQEFNQQLSSLASQQGSLVSQLTTIRATAMANAWTVLNPAQQQKARQLHEFGFGRGAFHGGPMGH